MSQWTRVDGTLMGVKESLTKEFPPHGLKIIEVEAEDLSSANSYLDGDTCDGIPGLRDWFAGLCERSQCTSAELDLDCVNRYHFEWDAERRVLVLDVPHLYREAIEAEAGCRT